jgi:AhpD family alkylhydroperoxidase
MATLNRAAAEAMNEVGASACTDVTGFGLFGHLISLCRHSGVTAQIYADRLPAFDGAIEALAGGVIPGAIERNTEYVGDDLSVADGVPEAGVLLGYDAQTSGGLMICVPAERHEKLLAALKARGTMAATIGRIVGKSDGKIVITLAAQVLGTPYGDASAAPVKAADDEPPRPADKPPARGMGVPGPSGSPMSPTGVSPVEPAATTACCGEQAAKPATPADDKSTAGRTIEAWTAMLRSSAADGAIDAKTKELITYALVILSRCGPCLRAHHDKAIKMGLAPEQLAEALWLAVFIGGAPVKMFYDETLASMASPAGSPSPQPSQSPKHKGGCCG